ncbi:lytic polysaccharide monooxygenase [Streptomyces sp. 5-8]|uniref:Lytic polysaccharide monooxygenase n=1 Tax=Streptomyces musisoli TaxID=2802280 RepID=A0ABS1NUL6_9ACTN|nr:MULTISPECIES: lytic polysaccharide monooxygenase [Streptomyces]MBL1103664.1 lytic polysaccharide monooxygenase [Streptomyces musisoli]MBY8839729.1 lytic polysaccharide monooxygenase [Streptomyces sp. SP2-10]
MTRMTARLSARLAAAAAPLLLLPWAAGSAQAHGAPTDPVSRVYACSPEGGAARTAACRAAIAANGAPFTAWDNLRVAGVGGRDRQVIPDGRLCSGNLPAYRGLDLARRDWPATRLAPGGRLTLTYASTIAHTGTFRLYLTRQGYDPSRPLTWSDLPERPFAEITDPPLRDGAYHLGATLPKDRTGRQMLYTVWQNSSTPDTYYSCSDVVFPEHGKAAGAARSTRPTTAAPAAPRPRPARSAGSPAKSPTPVPGRADGRPERAAGSGTPVAETTHGGSGPSAPLLAGGATAVLLLTGGAAFVLRLRRR